MSRSLMERTNDLFSSTLSLSSHEISSLVAHLETHSSQRLETLKALRKALKRSANHVPYVCQESLFQQINEIVSREKRVPIVCETLWLLVDIIASTPNLETHVSPILPIVVSFVGNESSDVRRASLRVLHVNMRHSESLEICQQFLIQFGIHSKDNNIQREVILALPLLFGDEFSRENLFPLVDCLARLLVKADNDLFYPVFLALQRFHSIVGNHVFRQYLEETESEAKVLYESVLSRNPSADSQQLPHETSLLERRDTQRAREESLESLEKSLSPLLRFGLFPSLLIENALIGSQEERLASIEAILAIIKESPFHQLLDLLPTMDIFLAQFIGGQLLEQNSFKITLTSLDIIEALVERMKTSIAPNLKTIVKVLSKRLGDQRTVVRDSVVKVIHHLMYSHAPQELLDLLLEEKPSKNPKQREEVINRVTAAVLTFPRQEFNLAKLCFSVSPNLTDNRRSVRLAALECLAVLAQALGPHRLSPLLSAVETIESTCAVDGLVAALQARLARRALPRCAADGTVRYVLSVQNFSGWFTAGNDADLEWIMMATPSSHSGTPPKKASNGSQGMSGIPLANIPFDRRRQQHVNNNSYDESIEDMGRRKSLAETNISQLLSSGQTVEENGRSPLLERPPFDGFRGVSFASDDLEERRESQEAEDYSLEIWRQYFSRFRKQLAESALHENQIKETHFGHELDSRKSDSHLHQFAQDLSESRAQSPPHSSSAPSTASQEHVLSTVRFEEKIPSFARSLSLPSIGGQEEEREELMTTFEPKEEELKDESKELLSEPEKPFSPFLNTPLPPLETRQEDEPTSEPPILAIQESTPIHNKSQTIEESRDNISRLDVWTQKDETLSSETSEEVILKKKFESKTPQMRRKRAQPIGRQSRSQSPQGRRRPSRAPQHLYIKTTPAIPLNANIRNILVNVAQNEGPFDNPLEAVKAALLALQDDAWTTKVEGMLAITRLATFHSNYLSRDQHLIVSRLIAEVKNLRSTVSRSAIFTLGELLAKLKHQIEPEVDAIVASLLNKSAENVSFIREDIERALNHCLDEMPNTRTALALMSGGANHRNGIVRRTCAHFLSLVVERMGAQKCLFGPRDLAEHLLPSCARFVQDSSPVTRFFGRKMFSILMTHSAFDKLLRKHVTPGLYRNIVGILEAIKRRGIGEIPQDFQQ